MKHIQLIRESLTHSFPIFAWEESVRVVTQCLYPSNELVQVVVRGGTDTFVVSDEGNAFRELSAVGVEINKSDYSLRKLVDERGLLLTDGVIASPRVNAEELGIAIAMVANASKEMAEWLFSHSRIKRDRNFKSVLQQFLKARFNDHVKHEAIVGASNKEHKFENLIVFPNGKRLIVDPVMHDANSINARLVANLDVRSAKYEDLEQRLVYDDREDWKPDELNLLQVGATVIPFSRASQAFERFSANA